MYSGQYSVYDMGPFSRLQWAQLMNRKTIIVPGIDWDESEGNIVSFVKDCFAVYVYYRKRYIYKTDNKARDSSLSASDYSSRQQSSPLKNFKM